MLAEYGCTVPWMPNPVICTAKDLNRTSIDALISTYDVYIKSGKILDMCQQPCNMMKFAFGWPDVSNDRVIMENLQNELSSSSLLSERLLVFSPSSLMAAKHTSRGSSAT